MFLMGDHILKPSLMDATGVDGNSFKTFLWSIIIKGSSHRSYNHLEEGKKKHVPTD